MPDLTGLSTSELAAIAGGADPRNVAALALLARTAPRVASAVARGILGRDERLEAEALRVLGVLDPPHAREWLVGALGNPGRDLLAAMVRFLAIDAPVPPMALPSVFRMLARKLTDEHPDLADVFFREYPARQSEPRTRAVGFAVTLAESPGTAQLAAEIASVLGVTLREPHLPGPAGDLEGTVAGLTVRLSYADPDQWRPTDRVDLSGFPDTPLPVDATYLDLGPYVAELLRDRTGRPWALRRGPTRPG